MTDPIKLPDCTWGELKAAGDRLTGGDDSVRVCVQSLDGVMLENVAIQILDGCLLIEGVFLP